MFIKRGGKKRYGQLRKKGRNPNRCEKKEWRKKTYITDGKRVRELDMRTEATSTARSRNCWLNMNFKKEKRERVKEREKEIQKE